MLVSDPSPSAFLVLLIAVSNINRSLVAASPSRPVLTISDYPLFAAYILKWGPSVFLVSVGQLSSGQVSYLDDLTVARKWVL